MVIPLGDVLLHCSSDRTRREEWGDSCPQRGSLLFGLAPSGVYPAPLISQGSGELLPHLFTLAETGSNETASAVSFLWHFPYLTAGRR